MAKKSVVPCRGINSKRASLSVQFVERFCQLAGTGYAGIVGKAIAEKRWSDVLDSEIDPGNYVNPWEYRVDYCISSLLSKADFLPLDVDRADVAVRKFIEAEGVCLGTNRRLKHLLREPSTGITMASYIHTAANKIARVLGDYDWDEAEAGFSWGPGASTRLPRSKASPVDKFSGKPECTLNATLAAYTSIRRIPLWWSQLSASGSAPCDILAQVDGNKVITVPKNAKTDRVIAIEPCMNMFLQKGIGAMIRRRLRKVGIDLNDQSRNQRLAFAASLSDSGLATVDLSAASDTISLELVRWLLPGDWYSALEALRSPSGVLPSGEKILYQKFSSMGNGYTFELESLIFWALASSVLELAEEKGVVGVYGDDIVFPSAHVPKLKELFSYCGFSINEKKSHVSGPFRESCGKHYFRGVDVTPFYIREDVNTVSRYYWLANSLCRWLSCGSGFLDSRYKELWDWVCEMVPPRFRFLIPEGVGDGGIVAPFDAAVPRRAPRGFCGWVYRVAVDFVETVVPDGPAAVLTSLSYLERGADQARPEKRAVKWNAAQLAARQFVSDVLRDKGLEINVPHYVRRVRPAKSVVLQWADLGPWI